MVGYRKLLFLLLFLSSSHKVVTTDCVAQPQIRLGVSPQESSSLRLVSLHCWLCPDVSAGDNIAPMIDGGHQVMGHGDDISTDEPEESLHAQLYLKLNGTIIDPFETPLIDYRFSVLNERNISASYYIYQYEPFYAEFSCVHNSTTKSSDLVFVYAHSYIETTSTSLPPDTTSTSLPLLPPMRMPTSTSLPPMSMSTSTSLPPDITSPPMSMSTSIETASTSMPIETTSSYVYVYTSAISTTIIITISTFAALLLMLTLMCLILVIRAKNHYKSQLKTSAHYCSNVSRRHRAAHHRSGAAFHSLETTPKTATTLTGQVKGGNILIPNAIIRGIPSHDKVCSEVAYKTCPNYDLTLRSPIESPPRLEMRLPEANPKEYIFSFERQDQDISPQPNIDYGYSDSGGVLNDAAHREITYPKICSNYSEASPELYVKFVDPVETIKFDCNGGSYSDEDNEVYLRVPEGAIPKGKIISIQVGVSFHSALVPLLPREVRPVSPLVKLCVMEEVDFKFLKPVRVTLPHFLDVADEEDAKQMGLQFMKCGHGLYCFHQSDGEASFYPKSNTATLRTTHFCTFCITANQRICSSKVNYRLVKVIPKNRQESMWRVNFCVTYYLKTCLQVLKKQFPDSSFEMKMLRKFKFSASGALEIHFERRLASGWQLALENTGKIFPKDVQYMDLDPEELEMMEEDGVYPPRFEVQVCGSHAREPANALICFRGMADTVGNDTTELLLEPVAFAASSGSPSSHRHMWHRNELGGSEPMISTPSQKETSARPISYPTGPAHSDLMNFVAAALPTKWRLVGVQLGLSLPRLDEIERNHPDCKRRFSAVFSEWEQQETSPFCWETVVSVLQTPSVEENRVAEEVKTHFMSSICSSSSSTGSTTSDKSSRYLIETRV